MPALKLQVNLLNSAEGAWNSQHDDVLSRVRSDLITLVCLVCLGLLQRRKRAVERGASCDDAKANLVQIQDLVCHVNGLFTGYFNSRPLRSSAPEAPQVACVLALPGPSDPMRQGLCGLSCFPLSAAGLHRSSARYSGLVPVGIVLSGG